MIRRGLVKMEDPILLFLLTSFCTAFLLFVFWGFLSGGYPEFSKVGWI